MPLLRLNPASEAEVGGDAMEARRTQRQLHCSFFDFFSPSSPMSCLGAELLYQRGEKILMLDDVYRSVMMDSRPNKKLEVQSTSPFHNTGPVLKWDRSR